MIGSTTTRALQDEFGISGTLAFRDHAFGGPVAELTSVHGTVMVAVQGAQVLSYVPSDNGEVLWVSPVARLGTGKALRGGIPVCWPWFGPHPGDTSQPAHGLVRASPWRVVETAAHEDLVRVRFAWALQEPVAGCPAGLSAQLDVTLGADLQLDLMTVNASSEAVELTQALHTYLRVGDVGGISVNGFEGQSYLDQLAPPTGTHPALEPQAGPTVFDREVDRIYATRIDAAGRSVATLIDPALARRIAVSGEGSGSTVVWNPWIAKAARLGDLGPDGYRQFVCIETANAAFDARTLPAGGSHRLTAIIHAVNG